MMFQISQSAIASTELVLMLDMAKVRGKSTITTYQVHDEGEEGERRGEQGVGVKELYCQVQACVPEKKKNMLGHIMKSY